MVLAVVIGPQTRPWTWGPALAALGIESATYDLNNLAADTLTFTVGGAALDAATLWPYGTLLAVLKTLQRELVP